MEYRFRDIEKKWQEWWNVNKVYKVSNDSAKPKYYVLDMFPYPSGAGLHVGHPLGYIASDIYARFKRLKGFNVLHPMGYDAFGLPAEQYAIEHGIHPKVSTDNNIENFRKQLNNIGFSFDWDREVRTSDPKFYKWTQWIFLQLFNSFYNRESKKAEPISKLIAIFEKEGNINHPVPDSKFEARLEPGMLNFSAARWKSFNEKTQQDLLMEYRLSYCGYGEVNWCEALGTVLANDEVINGVSERGGHPVVKKKLRQWYLRITEYADRLLEGLQKVDFSESMKEMQSNWIGKSSGAEIDFEIKDHSQKLRVYTTRPDTIFGVDFMVVAPELEMVNEIKSEAQTKVVDEYLAYVKSRSERERMAEKKITGVFTGSYAINPFNRRPIPIWISEYVLAGYGTGAIMAVPCGDQRDFLFAKHFNIPITNIIGSHFNGEEGNPTKDATLENSDFLNGIVMKYAIDVVINKIEEMGIGVRKVNYKMRDAAFSRQRYWGEPFPIIWLGAVACPLDESELPVVLPHMDDLKPGPDGEGPLSNLTDWKDYKGGIREVNTMPGYAGSSWYFLRYMDPDNDKEFCSRKASDYWGQVDLYIGGTEHAVGHLLYSRMWTKFLYDMGLISHEEPYKRLVNQGMIQGSSRFVYRITSSSETGPITKPLFVSFNKLNDRDLIRNRFSSQSGEALLYVTSPIHVDVNIVDGVELDVEAFKKWRSGEYSDAEFILEDGKYICGTEVEKMSKRYFNTVNPNDLCEKYGADTFRMYEMFLGPVEMSKPWDTKGIEGVHRFLKKLWRLFFDELKGKVWNEEKATDAELKILHKTIKKIEEDTERFSFNTGVSTFMICVNELTDLKCHKKEVLEQLLILLAPYAPHISEELWSILGNSGTILDAPFPKWNEKYLKETSKAYPVAINGKTRTELTLALDATQQQVEEIVMKDAIVTKWLEGKQPKKIIYVKNKMINVVV
ncbi:MAG TPA: class I tRNA ligase family protein [Chitinophagaceae bacterium]|nr:class I tRNA ligase family protein [Chitinophagaceae bacterium]